MTLPDDLYDRPAPEGARLLARHRLVEAGEAASRLAEGADPEALHDFRVALRRLRSTMRSYRPLLEDTVGGKRRRQVRDVAASTSVARDTEVHIAWLHDVRTDVSSRERTGVDWLLGRLRAREQEAQGQLVGRTLKAFRKVAATLDVELSRWHQVHYLEEPGEVPNFSTFTAELVRRSVSELEARLAEVSDVSDEVAPHEARIAGKRLRYLIEPVIEVLDAGAPLLRRLKGLQDALGDLHDSQVFSRELVAASAEAGAQVARAESAAVLEGKGRTKGRRRRGAGDPRDGLLALAERVRERGLAAWRSVEEEWLSDRAAGFLDDVRSLAAYLEALGADTVEIERKYLLAALPDEVHGHPSAELWQGYVPGRRLVERVRRVRDSDGERFYRTVKGGRGVHRLEVEEETSREIFDALWALTEGRRVHKRRWFVAGTAHTWEVDAFDDLGLFLAEVELASEQEAVELPDWLAPLVVREVTLEPEYGNLALAR